MANVNAPNVVPNVSNVGKTTTTVPDLQRVLDSLTLRQKRRYNNSNEKVTLLEMILDERKKSEVNCEIISVAMYAITTVAIALANALYFKSDESTKNFSLIINSVYYGA
ncbi:10428_t:CDS:2, partial [Funneliformis geosporum]